MRGLLADSRLRIYLVGQSFTLFGDTMLLLAVGIWVKSLTGSSAAAGLAFFFVAAPALFAPLGGLAVDRVRRRPLLLKTNLTLGAVVGLLLLVQSADQLWLIYAVMVVYGLGNQVIVSAQAALLPSLVPSDRLADTNGVLSLLRQGLRLVAPLAGAGLFSVSGPGVVVIVDVGTFAVAAFSLAFVRVEEDKLPRESASAALKSLGAGFQYIGQTPILRQLILAFVVGFSAVGLLETISFAVVSALGRPPSFLGVLVSIQGGGAVTAGLFVARLIHRAEERAAAVIGMALSGAGVGSLLFPSLIAAMVGMFLLGGGVVVTVVATNTLIQRQTPNGLIGRVNAATEAAVTVPQTIFIGLGAVLVSLVEYRLLLLVTSLLMLLTSLWLGSRSGVGHGDARGPGVRAAAAGRDVPRIGDGRAGD